MTVKFKKKNDTRTIEFTEIVRIEANQEILGQHGTKLYFSKIEIGLVDDSYELVSVDVEDRAE